MKYLYSIVFLFLFYADFAQSLKGAWVEYKRELVSTNQEILVKDENRTAFEFDTKKWEVYTPQSMADPKTKQEEYYFDSWDDTLYFHMGGDASITTPLYYVYKIDNKSLMLTECKKSGELYRYYLKKVNKLPKTYPPPISDNESKLYGKWAEYKREVIGDSAISNYTFDGRLGDDLLYYNFDANSNTILNYLDGYETSYEVKGDTLKLTIMRNCDCNVGRSEFPYLISFNGSNEMTMTDPVAEGQFGIKHYYKKIKKEPKELNQKWERFDKSPYFPGGEDSLKSFIQTHINKEFLRPKGKYHEIVKLYLELDSTGKVIDAEVLDNPLKADAKEAIRIARLLPNWIPAVSYPLNPSEITIPQKNVGSWEFIDIQFTY